MRTSKVLALLAEAERKHALERDQWRSERKHLLDRIMTLADHPMYDEIVREPPEEDDDIVDPEDSFLEAFMDDIAPVRGR